MFKKLLATSILATLSTGVMADVKVYGKVNLSVQSSDEGTGSQTELKSNSSRIGFKGSEALSNGLTIVYQYEMQVDVTDESGEKNLKSRNQYVGIKGGFGELLIGDDKDPATAGEIKAYLKAIKEGN
jgi:predicted porin